MDLLDDNIGLYGQGGKPTWGVDIGMQRALRPRACPASAPPGSPRLPSVTPGSPRLGRVSLQSVKPDRFDRVAKSLGTVQKNRCCSLFCWQNRKKICRRRIFDAEEPWEIFVFACIRAHCQFRGAPLCVPRFVTKPSGARHLTYPKLLYNRGRNWLKWFFFSNFSWYY